MIRSDRSLATGTGSRCPTSCSRRSAGDRHDARSRRLRPCVPRLPQDVQAMAFDVPDEFLAAQHHGSFGPDPIGVQLSSSGRSRCAAPSTTDPRWRWCPLLLCRSSAPAHSPSGIAFRWSRPLRARQASCCTRTERGPIGVTGCESANALAAQADVVLAVGSRLEDFTTGSWTLFQHPDVTIIGLNAARFDARKRRSFPGC